MNSIETIRKYGKLMKELPYEVGEDARILLKEGKQILATEPGADLGSLKDSEIADVTGWELAEKDALRKLKGYKALVVCKTPYAGIAADAGKSVPAVLDDMAQIVGAEAAFVPYRAGSIRRALKHNCAVLTEGGRVITAGRNLYEAYVAMTVLEKCAEIYMKANVIGGARIEPPWKAAIMHVVYQKKYSKAEKEHKDANEG